MKNLYIKKITFSIAGLINILNLSAQNLVVNPGAEATPVGTGWTIVSAGGNTCAAGSATSTYNNWTMVPDNSTNYPFDHTTAAAGGHTFFAGCNSTAGGPYELFQVIDVSTDAANIDGGSAIYIFTGYIQTPVSPQKDQGRFIVDYLDASNVILGTSYTSVWQSNFASSGSLWTKYTNTRTAPALTRKIKLRLQSQVFTDLPAINAYFDDISLVRGFVLPVALVSFKGNALSNENYITWQSGNQINLSDYQLQKGTDGTHFTTITTLPAGKNNYAYTDNNISNLTAQYFYRLKMQNVDGKSFYSDVLAIKSKTSGSIKLFPNPAKNIVTLSGLQNKGVITIIDIKGKSVLSLAATGSQTQNINISGLATGLYFVNFNDGKTVTRNKLIVQ